jgi:hypothetical protein
MVRYQRVVAVFALLLMFLATTAPAAAGTSVDDPERGVTDTGSGAVADRAIAAQNNSTSHENPEEAAEDGDAAAVERWLTNRLSEQLEGSTIELSQGEYEAAREYVGDDYSERVDQLVDVEGETDESGDDDEENDSSSTFQRAQENQTEYVSSVQDYRETRERYEEAKQNGNQTGARRLARRLNEIAAGVNETGVALVRSYETVTNVSDRNLDEEARTIENITANITDQQREIRDAEFLQTNLSVELQSADVSFLDPIVVTGRATTANGTALTNETVELQFGERTTRVRTNGSGEFALSSNETDDLSVRVTDDGDLEVAVDDAGTAEATTNESGTFRLVHRPTVQSVNESTATVRFVPDGDSIYLGTEETVEVDVEQVTPTVTIDDAPSAVAFDDATTVNGSVAVDNVPVRGVPVVIRVGETRVGVARTDAAGRFSLTTRLPAAVRSGSTTVAASLPFEDRALASTAAERPITVLETDTSLTLSTTAVDDERVRTTGTLTADGEAVAGQTVEIRINGSVVETARTNETGGYNVTAEVPAAARADGTIQIAAVYATDGTNLRDARAREIFVLNSAAGPESPIDRRIIVVAALALVVALAGGASLWRRRRQSDAPTSDRSVATDENDERLEPEELSLETVGPLDAATTALEEGQPDRAVELAYGGVRQRLGDALDVHPVHTHWEFYRACQDAGLNGDAAETLERLTEAYERAAYAPDSLNQDEANAVINGATGVELSP